MTAKPKEKPIDPQDTFPDNPVLQALLEDSVGYILNVSKHPATFRHDAQAILRNAMAWCLNEEWKKLGQ